MSDIGPALPPHLLAKRKRRQEEDAAGNAAASSGAKPESPGLEDGEKRRRIVGPAMPPAPLDERPVDAVRPAIDQSDSDDDDDSFGPALPSSHESKNAEDDADGSKGFATGEAESAPSEERMRRDEWMMMPPKQDDLAARMDPTKQRARGFNTGKGATTTASNDDDGSTWHETPEQKQKRLADEMMGVSKSSATGPQQPRKGSSKASADGAATRKIKDHTEKTRGPSLLDQHQKTKGKDAEDDPSKRAFDREKDMGSGMRIGGTQRKELLNKASNSFSSKFSGGSYL